MTDSPTVALARRYAEQHLPPDRRAWLIKTAAEVERQYTTALVRFDHQGRVYDIPANFFSYVGREWFRRFEVAGEERYEISRPRSELDVFYFFWPEFGGYTLDNWFDPFDKRKIKYAWFQILAAGQKQATTGEILENLRNGGLIEASPSAELFGLKGYRRINQREFLWVGQRANGELFTMSSFHPDEKDAYAAMPNFQCKVKLYDDKSREEVMYHYSIDLFPNWQEIDTRTNETIRSWRVS
jgi:hypothetical protein